MNLKNHAPVFVPREFRGEMEKLSKAALMDMVWDYATQIGVTGGDTPMGEFRKRREVILAYRERYATSNV